MSHVNNTHPSQCSLARFPPPPKLTASFLTPRLPFSDPVLVFLYFFLFFMASTAFCFFVAGEMATRRAEKAWQTPALLCM